MGLINHILALTAAVLVSTVTIRAHASSAPHAPNDFIWQSYAPIETFAVARPFSGMIGDQFVVIGGSSFDQSPALGGKKQLRTESYIYNQKSQNWLASTPLPTGLAEGMSASVKDGLFCVGGVASKDAFIASIDVAGKLIYKPVADFPAKQSISMAASAVWKDSVYIIGGLVDGQMSKAVWRYDVADDRWTQLADLPGPARAQAVAAMQNGDQKQPVLIVFGGTGIGGDGKQIALTDGFGLVAAKGDWIKLTPAPVATIGAAFLPVGDQHILLVGGYNGEQWNRANRMTPAELKAFMLQDAPAFKWNRTLYTYHTVTGAWAAYGQLPDGQPARCGAAAAIIDHRISELKTEKVLLLYGGEDKPGHRIAQFDGASLRSNWSFSWLSWTVIVVYFLIMGLMALYFALKEKTADTYFRGGKSIPWVVAGMSIFATMLSSITFISIPTMTFIADWRYFPMVVLILALVPIVVKFYLPFFCRLKITSAYEYLEARFNLGTRLFGALVFNIFMLCRVAVVTLLPAIALNAVTGIDVRICILLCGISTTLYCLVGGVDAVIWSDFVQGIILLFGAVAVLGLLLWTTEGGLEGFYAIASADGKLQLLDFRWLFQEPTFWVVVIMGLVSNLSSYTSDQCVVQRYITTTNEKAAANSIWFNGLMSVGASIIFYMIGTALYTHYKTNPALMDITMSKSDSVFPLYMAMELHPLIAGLIIAAIFAATVSTLSTNINSAATSITTDFFLRFKPCMTSDEQVRCGRRWVLIVGVLGTGAALILSGVPNRSLFDVFNNFIGMLTSGLSALFLMGVFMPRVGGKAALVGLISNYAVTLALGFLPMAVRPHPFVFGGIGLVVCVIVALAISAILPNRKPTRGLTYFEMPDRID